MRIILILCVMTIIIACSTGPSFKESDYTIEMGNVDSVYHLTLDPTRTQTIHRIDGKLLTAGGQHFPQKVHFQSSHTWWFDQGDTVITIYRRTVSADGTWVNLDILHWVTYDSLEVPTVNPTSYTNSIGEFSTVIAPILAMIGDTLTIQATWYSDWYTSDTARSYIRFVLE